jgi:hypothetical protein
MLCPRCLSSGGGGVFMSDKLGPPYAGYNPAWISFDASVCHVMRAVACDQGEAIKGIAKACEDGRVASRYGNTHETINPVSWRRLAVRKGYVPGTDGGDNVLA